MTTETPETRNVGALLQSAIADALNREDGRQILNRAQQQLEDDEEQVKSLTEERNDLASRLAKGEESEKQLHATLDLMRRNLADLNVLIDSKLNAIHTLRQKGVTL